MPIPRPSLSNGVEALKDQAACVPATSNGHRLMMRVELPSPRMLARGIRLGDQQPSEHVPPPGDDWQPDGEVYQMADAAAALPPLGPEQRGLMDQGEGDAFGVRRRIEELVACQKEELLELVASLLNTSSPCMPCSNARGDMHPFSDTAPAAVTDVLMPRKSTLSSKSGDSSDSKQGMERLVSFRSKTLDDELSKAGQSHGEEAESHQGIEEEHDVASNADAEEERRKSEMTMTKLVTWRTQDRSSNSSTTRWDMGDQNLLMKALEARKESRARLEEMRDGAVAEISSMRKCAKSITVTTWFESAAFLAIISSSIVLGLQVDQSSKSLDGSTPPFFKIAEYTFCILFTIELVLRVIADGAQFLSLRVRNAGWNYFDLVCVSISIIAICMDLAPGSAGGGGESTMAAISRIGRMVRVVRVLRLVKFIPQLKIIVTTFWSTLAAMVWVLILMSMVMFLFAVVMTQGAVSHMVAHPENHDGALPEHFGTIMDSMYTLYMVVTNGISWNIPAKILGSVHYGYRGVFLAYISVITFAFFNVITGFICEHSIATVQKDRELLADAQVRNKNAWQESFKKLFSAVDVDGSGELTMDEFEEHRDDVRVRAYFETLDLDLDKAWDIFRLLDDDESGTVSMDEFVEGCLKLRGQARSMDLAILGYDFQKVANKLAEFMSHVEEELTDVKVLLQQKLGMRMNVTRASKFEGQIISQRSVLKKTR